MEVDRIFEYRDGIELMEGDRIVYENVGGYTMSLNPLFIQYFPDVYIRRDGKLYKIRKPLDAEGIYAEQHVVWRRTK